MFVLVWFSDHHTILCEDMLICDNMWCLASWKAYWFGSKLAVRIPMLSWLQRRPRARNFIRNISSGVL